MTLTDEVRSSAARIAENASWVSIQTSALAEIEPGPPPTLDGRFHYLEGSAADVADYLLVLDTINFGSGWFPLLAKRSFDGCPLSGYFTVAWALAEHLRSNGPASGHWLRQVSSTEIAEILGQRPDLELMSLYAQALRALGTFLGERRALDLLELCGRSAERLAAMLVEGMPMFADHGFYKRAQITASDLALAGVAEFDDLDRLTVFADNLVPHVLRLDGVLIYERSLAKRIDAGETLALGGPEREIRACAVHACELISHRSGVPARVLDGWLWNRGQAPAYKQYPRHRCRTVFY
ncbi:MAG: queuosine salvage family protein [Solirubrobacteraceae bacterium]